MLFSRCQKGYEMINAKCVDIDECQDSPCFGGSTCVNKEGNFKCVCGQLWTGTLCNMPRNMPVTSAASLTTGALVAILVSLFIMLSKYWLSVDMTVKEFKIILKYKDFVSVYCICSCISQFPNSPILCQKWPKYI